MLTVAIVLAVVGSNATAGMSMGSSGKRDYDRDRGYYPGYNSGDRGRRCRGDGPCDRDGYSQGYGPGMGMGSGYSDPRREQYRYQNQYRYGEQAPGYGPQGGQGYGPQGGQGYGQQPGYAPSAPAGGTGSPDADRGYRGTPGYGRGGPGGGRSSPGYRGGGGF